MKTKLLLVDDDPSVVSALSAVLRSEGYDVIPAVNGHEAIQGFYKHPDIAIVLLDICMPVKGAGTPLRGLRKLIPFCRSSSLPRGPTRDPSPSRLALVL